MMQEVAKLLDGSKKRTRYLDPATFDRTIDILLSIKSAPGITKKPEEPIAINCSTPWQNCNGEAPRR